jgi:transposase InsO family protein
VPYGYELTLRVDRRAQFTARNFREAARTLNVRLECAGVQYPEDKPYIGPFFGSYKAEELYRNDRLHQALWYKSPRDYAKIAF